MSKKTLYGLGLCLCIIGVTSLFLIKSEDQKKIVLHGTYQNEEWAFHSIVFDAEYHTYEEKIYDSENGTLVNEGTFSLDNDIPKITSGKYEDYFIEIEEDILVLSKQDIQIRFKKISDIPIYTVEE